MKLSASATWWRITTIIALTSPAWVKALSFASNSWVYNTHIWLLPALLGIGLAALLWFAWSGLQVAWLAISACFARKRRPAPRLSAAPAHLPNAVDVEMAPSLYGERT